MVTSQNIIPLLSKSRFIAGLQCVLRLWHESYNPDLAPEISAAQQAIFDMGHEVGELATHLYTGGILIKEDHLHHEEGVLSTLKAIQDPGIPAIFEAAFTRDGVRIRVDILERAGDGMWNLIEVKSSTSVKDVHIQDVAVQYHVLGRSGVDIDRVFLMHVNNEYLYDGEKLDLKGFFKSVDLTEKVMNMQDGISSKINEFNNMLAQPLQPEVFPSRHCLNPYECEFWEYCTSAMPEHWVMELPGITQKRLNVLTAMNIREIIEIPHEFPLGSLQERVRTCITNNEEYISAELNAELLDVQYPVHFLDFEAFGPAIPRYAGTRPYQAIPFQWSDHILYTDGRIGHREYICCEYKDPREEFTDTLIKALGEGGTVFIYTNYETGIINALAEQLPLFRERLVHIPDRFMDLCALIKKHFYHPGFHGSFSLKSVLPALVPGMNYEDLAIKEGSQASLEYMKMINTALSPEEKARIKNELLTYCGYDTLAMVKIREELLKRMV